MKAKRQANLAKRMNDPHLHQRLGPYLLESVVGRGGMGNVYRAIDQETQQPTAVKLLSPALAGDSAFRERFSAEIESLKKLRHPNIVQLIGYGEQDGQLYYSMELIDGKSLQEELRQGRRFDWREVTQIAIDVCAALKHAHDHGVIHRDLKPANLLYPEQRYIKLLDFGIAKLFGNTSVTTGNVMGTADYMAPEQAEGKAVGPRSDLYSLGSVMYALLTGHPPFVGKSVPEVVHKVRFEPPIPVIRLARDVPIELDQLIDQLLQKNPQKRIPTALATTHRLKAMEHALSVRLNEEAKPPIEDRSAQIPAAQADPNEQETIQLVTEREPTVGEDLITVETHEPDADLPGDHFTMVATEADTRPRDRFPWQIAPLALLLLLIVLLGYQSIKWATRPPDAESLYETIVENANAGSSAGRFEAERNIERFLKLYADDPHAEEVTNLGKQLRLYRVHRRLEDRAFRRQQDVESSPIEQLYVEILALLRTDPDVAYSHLQAFVDLYGQTTGLNAEQTEIVELAKQQLGELKRQIAQRVAAHRPLIQRQLESARSLAQNQPHAARRIYESIVLLYQDKSWAQDLVEQATSDLDALTVDRDP